MHKLSRCARLTFLARAKKGKQRNTPQFSRPSLRSGFVPGPGIFRLAIVARSENGAHPCALPLRGLTRPGHRCGWGPGRSTPSRAAAPAVTTTVKGALACHQLRSPGKRSAPGIASPSRSRSGGADRLPACARIDQRQTTVDPSSLRPSICGPRRELFPRRRPSQGLPRRRSRTSRWRATAARAVQRPTFRQDRTGLTASPRKSPSPACPQHRIHDPPRPRHRPPRRA